MSLRGAGGTGVGRVGGVWGETAVSSTNEQTVITMTEESQSQLLRLLGILDENGLEILSVKQRRSNLEEIFLNLTNGA